MKKVEVELEVITPMFSYGADTRCAEFRVTELKALMRTTFREVYKFDNIEDMKKKEGELFGNLDHKSPIRFKCKRYIGEKKEALLPHRIDEKRKSYMSSIESGTKIDIEMLIESEEDINIYIDLLILSSILGGIGRRSRKGFGSFKINKIRYKNKNEYTDLISFDINEIFKRVSESDGNYSSRKLKETCEENEMKFSEPCNELEKLYPYLEKLQVKEIGKNMSSDRKNIFSDIRKEVSQLAHIRLNYEKFWSSVKTKNSIKEFSYRKDILGNFNVTKSNQKKENSITRFSAPICISFWENNTKKYVILKELNYKYILKKLDLEEGTKEYDNTKMYIKEYKRKIREIFYRYN